MHWCDNGRHREGIGKIKPLFTQSHPPASAHPLPPCARWCPRLGSAHPPHAARLAQALPGRARRRPPPRRASPGGSRQATGQPQARGPVGLGHVGALPLPAGAFGDLEALLNPGPQPIPTGGTGLRRQVRQDQPRILVARLPAGQQRAVELAVAAFEGDARPLPRRARLGHQRLQGHPAHLALWAERSRRC